MNSKKAIKPSQGILCKRWGRSSACSASPLVITGKQIREAADDVLLQAAPAGCRVRWSVPSNIRAGRDRAHCDLTKYTLDYNTLNTSPTTQGHHREAGSWTLNKLSPYPIHSLLLRTTSSDCSVPDRITEATHPPITPSFTGWQHQKIYRYSPYILKVYWRYFTSIATISAQTLHSTNTIFNQ